MKSTMNLNFVKKYKNFKLFILALLVSAISTSNINIASANEKNTEDGFQEHIIKIKKNRKNTDLIIRMVETSGSAAANRPLIINEEDISSETKTFIIIKEKFDKSRITISID